MDSATKWPVDRSFVETAFGSLHYVRQGEGPTLVMLHAAPCSAKVMEPLQAEWAAHFTTFAFDLPGFGLSDPPAAERVETHHLADAVAAAITALGLGKVTLYGRHTGAGVAVEIARRHPDLCAFVLTDGYPVFANPYDDQRLAEYLTPIVPAWDGSHLTWTWFRYREQHMFWPWDRPALASRADTDLPDLDFLHRGTVELLEARETYQRVYASAFRHPGLAVIDEVKVPVCYGNRPGDSQHKTVRLYPDHAWVHVFPRDPDEAAAEELKILLAHGRSEPAPAFRGPSIHGRSTLRDYIPDALAPIYARGAGLDRDGAPLLVLHDLPGSIDLHLEDIDRLDRMRPVLGFDFFGNGNSRVARDFVPSIDAYVDQLEHVLDHLGWEKIHLLANGTSAAVAAEFASRHPDRVGQIAFRSPPLIEADPAFAAAYAPDISPEWSGGNLLKLWHHLRDQELWWPWFERRIGNAKKTEPRIEPEALQRRALVLLKQPWHYQAIWRAVLDCDLSARLASMAHPATVVSEPRDIFAFAAPRAAAALGSGPVMDLSDPDAIDRLGDWFDAPRQ